jgi:hypothetical protein
LLFEAKEALISGDFIFEIIEYITNEEFAKIEILAGIKILLKI